MKTKPFYLGLLALGLALVACSGGEPTSSSSDEAGSPSSSSPVDTGSESSSSSSSSESSDSGFPSDWEEYDLKTVAELIELSAGQTGKPDSSSPRYYVAASVKSIDDPQYGGMTIEDETGEIMVYGTYSADGETRYGDMEEKPVAGDYVLLYGNLQEYKGTPEIYSGWIIDLGGELGIVDVGHPGGIGKQESDFV